MLEREVVSWAHELPPRGGGNGSGRGRGRGRGDGQGGGAHGEEEWDEFEEGDGRGYGGWAGRGGGERWRNAPRRGEVGGRGYGRSWDRGHGGLYEEYGRCSEYPRGKEPGAWGRYGDDEDGAGWREGEEDEDEDDGRWQQHPQGTAEGGRAGRVGEGYAYGAPFRGRDGGGGAGGRRWDDGRDAEEDDDVGDCHDVRPSFVQQGRGGDDSGGSRGGGSGHPGVKNEEQGHADASSVAAAYALSPQLGLYDEDLKDTEYSKRPRSGGVAHPGEDGGAEQGRGAGSDGGVGGMPRPSSRGEVYADRDGDGAWEGRNWRDLGSANTAHAVTEDSRNGRFWDGYYDHYGDRRVPASAPGGPAYPGSGAARGRGGGSGVDDASMSRGSGMVDGRRGSVGREHEDDLDPDERPYSRLDRGVVRFRGGGDGEEEDELEGGEKRRGAGEGALRGKEATADMPNAKRPRGSRHGGSQPSYDLYRSPGDREGAGHRDGGGRQSAGWPNGGDGRGQGGARFPVSSERGSREGGSSRPSWDGDAGRDGSGGGAQVASKEGRDTSQGGQRRGYSASSSVVDSSSSTADVAAAAAIIAAASAACADFSSSTVGGDAGARADNSSGGGNLKMSSKEEEKEHQGAAPDRVAAFVEAQTPGLLDKHGARKGRSKNDGIASLCPGLPGGAVAGGSVSPSADRAGNSLAPKNNDDDIVPHEEKGGVIIHEEPTKPGSGDDEHGALNMDVAARASARGRRDEPGYLDAAAAIAALSRSEPPPPANGVGGAGRRSGFMGKTDEA